MICLQGCLEYLSRLPSSLPTLNLLYCRLNTPFFQSSVSSDFPCRPLYLCSSLMWILFQMIHSPLALRWPELNFVLQMGYYQVGAEQYYHVPNNETIWNGFFFLWVITCSDVHSKTSVLPRVATHWFGDLSLACTHYSLSPGSGNFELREISVSVVNQYFGRQRLGNFPVPETQQRGCCGAVRAFNNYTSTSCKELRVL